MKRALRATYLGEVEEEEEERLLFLEKVDVRLHFFYGTTFHTVLWSPVYAGWSLGGEGVFILATFC